MSTHKTEDRNGHPVTNVQLEAGETVWLCRCFHSQKFPFCDGTHRQHNGLGPVQVAAPKAEESK